MVTSSPPVTETSPPTFFDSRVSYPLALSSPMVTFLSPSIVTFLPLTESSVRSLSVLIVTLALSVASTATVFPIVPERSAVRLISLACLSWSVAAVTSVLPISLPALSSVTLAASLISRVPSVSLVPVAWVTFLVVVAEVSLAFSTSLVAVTSCSSRALFVASSTVVAVPPSFAISLSLD